MKKLLNTLFVTTQGAYLAREGETLVVRVDGEIRLRVPVHTLQGVVCFGNVGCSPFLMGLCGERGVLISFLTERGRFLARVHGRVSGNVLLRRTQYRHADASVQSLSIGRILVAAKVANCRAVLQRAARERGSDAGATSLARASEQLARMLPAIGSAADLAEIRGKEGEAARCYFGVFDHLIVSQKEDFFFTVRTRRPPLDNMNSLLSFLYALLRHDTASALEAVGLDPQVGFLHRERPGRESLALDLMEEMRPYLADRLALTLVNRRQVSGRGFRGGETGDVQMDDDTRKQVLVAYQKRKQENITHPFLGERVPLGLLPHVQAMLLARYLRGDLDAYPPFLMK
jgi:CRISPR-associated protein Cas1